MIKVGVAIFAHFGTKIRLRVAMMRVDQGFQRSLKRHPHALLHHSGEVSGRKNAGALSASHFGKSVQIRARHRLKNLLVTPSGLSAVFRLKGSAGATRRARLTRFMPCRVR